jgi:hypothetical protein
MPISKDEAAQALGEVAAARGRLWQAVAYDRSSPFLILWGLVWLAADLITQFEPAWRWTWPIAVVLGMIPSFAIGLSFRKARTGDAPAPTSWRNFVVWWVVLAFVLALFAVLPPATGRQVHSVFGLLFGFLYVGMGLWMGWRLAALGAALVVLTLAGYFFVGAWYPAYMGLVAGGALVLGGLWLRRV